MMRAVRGAIALDDNTPETIKTGVQALIESLLSKNSISPVCIISVFFTVTPDLSAMNPAQAIREARSDWQQVPMLCMQEPVMDAMLPRCIRVLVQWHADSSTPSEVHPVYMGAAQNLRPDLQ